MDTLVVRQAKPLPTLLETPIERCAREVAGLRRTRRMAVLAAVCSIVCWLTLLWLQGSSITAADLSNAPCASRMSCAEAKAPLPSVATLERWSGVSDRSAEPDQDPDAQLPIGSARVANHKAAATRAFRQPTRFSEVASPNIRGPPA